MMVNPLLCAVALIAFPLLTQTGCIRATNGSPPLPNAFNFTLQDGARGITTEVVGMGIDPAGDVHVVGAIGCFHCSASGCFCPGTVFDGVALPAQAQNYFLTTYDAGGKRKATVLLDSRKLDVEDGFGVSGVAFDRAGNTYMTGTTTAQYRLVKIDANGAKVWSIVDGSVGDTNLLDGTRAYVPTAVAVDPLGNAYVTGRDRSGFFFLSKYDSAGTRSWTFIEKHPGPGENFPDASNSDIAIDPSGLPGTISILGSQGVAVAADSLGNAYVAGVASAIRNTAPDRQVPDCAFLARFDPAGTKSWMVVDHAPNSDVDALRAEGSPARATVVATSSSGDVYVAGSVKNSQYDPRFDGLQVQGVTSTFVSKYTSTGARTWTAVDGSPGYIVVTGIAVDGAGNAFLTGSGDLLKSDGGTAFLVRYAADGTKTWAHGHTVNGLTTPRPPAFARGVAVAVDTRGHVYQAGSAGGSVDGQNYLAGGAGTAEQRLETDYFLSQMNVSGP